MTSVSSPVGCARCGTILDPHFRFCPECALPASGEAVLSTEIAELRRRVEADANGRRSASWTRWVVPTSVVGMLAFVVMLGFVLFNRPILNRLLPSPGEGQAAVAVPHAPNWQPRWISIPPGTFPYDVPEKHIQGQVPYEFLMSEREIDNALWLEYLTAERRHIEELRLWEESFPSKVDGWSRDAAGNAKLAPEWRSYPVTNVSPVAIGEFCAWLTRRLGKPGWEIRMPTQLEWEYAARGNGEKRTYTWGNDDVVIPIPQSFGNTKLRTGIGSKTAVDDPQLAKDDRSPFGVVAMGTNVSEWTIRPDFADHLADTPERELDEYLTADQLRENIEQQLIRVAWRGASGACDAEDARRLAQPWRVTRSEPRDMKPDIGIRLVKVKVSR